MDEVAPFAEMATSLLREGVAGLGLVGSIVFHVDPQLVRTVSELTLPAVAAVTLFREVLAERGLCLQTGSAHL